jgi:hypothetical protein
VGLLFGFVFLTRPIASLGVLFFVQPALSRKKKTVDKLKTLVSLLFPILTSVILFMFYNYQRFGNAFETGYKLADAWALAESQRFELLNYGLFNLKNIPTNIYYYFVKSLDPVLVQFNSSWGNTHLLKPPYVKAGFPGVSFFVASPVFLYIFGANFNDKIIKLSLLPTIAVTTVLLCYYWPGWIQVGPRYLLDILPFLYLWLLNSFRKRKLGRLQNAIIYSSAIFNLYLFFTVLASIA